MIYGSVFICTNITETMQVVNTTNAQIATITEEQIVSPDGILAPDSYIMASCLLPPPVAKIAEIDGDAERFYELYREYLLSSVPAEFLAIVLGHLHNGGNIAFLVTCGLDEPWLIQFGNHLMSYYGIGVGTKLSPPSYDQKFNDIVNGILFVGGMIKPEEYIFNKTIGFIPPEFVYIRLIEYFGVPQGKDPVLFFEWMSTYAKEHPGATPAIRWRIQDDMHWSLPGSENAAV